MLYKIISNSGFQKKLPFPEFISELVNLVLESHQKVRSIALDLQFLRTLIDWSNANRLSTNSIKYFIGITHLNHLTEQLEALSKKEGYQDEIENNKKLISKLIDEALATIDHNLHELFLTDIPLFMPRFEQKKGSEELQKRVLKDIRKHISEFRATINQTASVVLELTTLPKSVKQNDKYTTQLRDYLDQEVDLEKELHSNLEDSSTLLERHFYAFCIQNVIHIRTLEMAFYLYTKQKASELIRQESS